MTDSLTSFTRFEPDKWPFSPSFQDFADFLGLSPDKDAKGVNWRFDQKTADKMQKIYVWGMVKSKTNDHEKIKEMVYNLQRKIGTNWEGKTLIDRLWQHTMFDTQFKKEVEKLYKQIESNKEEKEEPVKVDRPKKGIPKEASPINERKVKYETYEPDIKIKNIKGSGIKSEPIEI